MPIVEARIFTKGIFVSFQILETKETATGATRKIFEEIQGIQVLKIFIKISLFVKGFEYEC